MSNKALGPHAVTFLSFVKRPVRKLFFTGCIYLTLLYPGVVDSSAAKYQGPAATIDSSPLTERAFDIGRVALMFAKEAYPTLEVEAYSSKLDQMVHEIRALTKGSKDPDHRIRVMNTYLYKHQGFQYDHGDSYARKLKNRYLNGLLDTKSGSCFTMPLLYLALAQRLGYPVYPVSAPQHLLLR